MKKINGPLRPQIELKERSYAPLFQLLLHLLYYSLIILLLTLHYVDAVVSAYTVIKTK